MNTKILLLGTIVTAFAFTSFAAGNQIRTVQGLDTDLNPAQVCRNTMNGTPKLVAECSSHTTMPGCVAVAALK